MCKIYNPVGSLTAIKDHLRAYNINDFNSVKELINFRNDFSSLEKQISENHRQAIQAEAESLAKEVPEIKVLIDNKRTDLEQSLTVARKPLELKINNLSLSHSDSLQKFLSPL